MQSPKRTQCLLNPRETRSRWRNPGWNGESVKDSLLHDQSSGFPKTDGSESPNNQPVVMAIQLRRVGRRRLQPMVGTPLILAGGARIGFRPCGARASISRARIPDGNGWIIGAWRREDRAIRALDVLDTRCPPIA